MSDTLSFALTASVDFLQDLAREGARPRQAKERLRALDNMPGIRADLVWEEEPYDQSVHYDVLLHLAAVGGTISLSYCPDRAVPWPLRGVHRTHDADLLRVNRTVMRVDQAIGCLDFWNEDRIAQRLVDVCIIEEELEKNPLELTHDELQRAMDAFRRARRLYRAVDTREWMARQGLTHEKLERLVADQAIVEKLRERVAAGRVDAYFDEHRADFDAATIARIDYPDRESAEQALEEIQRGEADFYDAAERQAAAAALRGREASSYLVSAVRRADAGTGWESAVFSAAPREIIGPVRDGDSYALVRVLSFAPASLDEPTRQAIRNILFTEWLAERRQAATIEWFWGTATQTSRTVNAGLRSEAS